MKNWKITAIITMIVSLIISIVSGYCTVVGMGKVFASAAGVTMFIAAVIELGRIVLLYDLHHFWDKLKLYQKIPGILMLLIAICLSAMGVFGFMSNAHSQRTQEVIPIEMEIKQKQSEIKILNDSIYVNNQQISNIENDTSNKAFEKYTEMGYVTKAVNMKKEQQKVTTELYNDNRQKQQEITKLNQDILLLQLDAEKKAPTLAHLKYYAKLFNVDNDTAIIIFIVMIMTVFDTLAMYLMITSDWISKLDNKENINLNNDDIQMQETNDVQILLTKIDEKDKQILDNIKQVLSVYKSESIKDDIDFTPIFNAIKQDSDYQVESLKKIVNENNKSLLNKLNEEFIKFKDSVKMTDMSDSLKEKLQAIESKITDMNISHNLNVETKNNADFKKNIDNNLTKLVNLIIENDDVLNNNDFVEHIINNPLLLKKLEESIKNNPNILNKQQILKKLNKFNY